MKKKIIILITIILICLVSIFCYFKFYKDDELAINSENQLKSTITKDVSDGNEKKIDEEPIELEDVDGNGYEGGKIIIPERDMGTPEEEGSDGN